MDDVKRQYRLVHQKLAITGIHFETHTLVGYTTLSLLPTTKGLRSVLVSCKQCTIFEVVIGEEDTAKFCYNDPTMGVCSESAPKSVSHFQKRLKCAIDSLDPDQSGSELTVEIPGDLYEHVDNLKPFQLTIEFSLENPSGGVQFVVPRAADCSVADSGVHMFTYGRENHSRLWFPCIDSYCEPCTWTLDFTVHHSMMAVCCGDLERTTVSADLKTKTYHYDLNIPTSALNIGLAVGHFESMVDQHRNELTQFCLPQLKPLLEETTSVIYEAFEFFEELLSVRYPYSCYKQVFVDEAYEDVQVFATMTIFSTNLLRSDKIVDQTPTTRLKMTRAIAQQFFGCFIAKKTWADSWLTVGISSYLTMQFQKSFFGDNDYRFTIAEMMKEVQEYERDVTKVVLNPFTDPYVEPEGPHPAPLPPSPSFMNVSTGHMVPARYLEVFALKATLILRLLEMRIGKELLVQVLNKLMLLASLSATERYESGMWNNLHVTTQGFIQSISTVTGKEVGDFVNRWVYQGGCARFVGSFFFNPKRNVVELEIKQELNAKGGLNYVGPLTVTIQELDGSFNHTFKIEENKYKFEITCHSKSRRNKKKKIPLLTGEEVDMDLSAMDANSPVLWLRVDPDMHLLRHVTWEQPDFMWQYQARYERDVVAQGEAISALQQYPDPATRRALTDTLENEHVFYKVRIEAAHCLAKVANSMASGWSGPPAMMTIFRKLFSSQSCTGIVRQNRFTNLQHYHLQKVIPLAMATLRDSAGICPPDVVRFILDLFKYNDNSRNKYSDCYYRANLVDALAKTVTPSVTMATAALLTADGRLQEIALSSDMKAILEEVTLRLNLEKLLPSYRYVVTVSCLRALRAIQRNGHIASDSAPFKTYAQYGVFEDVRVAAIEILVGFVQEGRKDHQPDLNFLLRLAESDPMPSIRYMCLSLLADSPPFSPGGKPSDLNDAVLADRLWGMLNTSSYWDPRLRCELVRLYAALYGDGVPGVLSVKTPTSMVISGGKMYPSMRDDSTMPPTQFGAAGGATVADASVSSRPNSADIMVDSGNHFRSSEAADYTSKAKKRKKKSKHKHKHKRDKKSKAPQEGLHPGSTSTADLQYNASAYQSHAVEDHELVLSEASSSEAEVVD